MYAWRGGGVAADQITLRIHLRVVLVAVVRLVVFPRPPHIAVLPTSSRRVASKPSVRSARGCGAWRGAATKLCVHDAALLGQQAFLL